MIQALPKNSHLFHSLSQIREIFKVKELPTHYDGYAAYELPPTSDLHGMVGIEQCHDSHL